MRFESGWSLDFQLKASKNCGIEQNSIVYDLEADTYRKLYLRQQNGATPILLIVMGREAYPVILILSPTAAQARAANSIASN
jgi:hypothetical protein